jgi:hypothetical protein
MLRMTNKATQALDDDVVLQTAILSAFILASAITICVLAVIPSFVQASVNPSALKHLFIIAASEARPEPAEFLQYITGVFLFPLLALGLASILRQGLSHLAKRTNLILLRNILGGFIIVPAMFLIWYDNLVLNQIYMRPSILFTHPLVFSVMVLAALALIVYSSEARVADWLRHSRLGRLLISIPLYGLALLAGLINIFTSSAITLDPVYTNHFNAVFYAMSQVHAGKTILVDLVHQYGLYPHFLNLIFAATNLSVFKYTFVMAILVAIGMASVAMFLRREISNALLGLGGFFSIVYYGYFILKPAPGYDPYFQYMPVRFIGPAVFILMASFYFKKRTPILYVGISIFASFAVLWNLDTGAIVLASWLLSLAYIEFLERPFKEAILKFTLRGAAALAIFMACVGLYLTLMFLRSGALLNLGMAFSYQRYFAQYGFFQLPMPSMGPWNIVMLIYTLGLTYAVMILLRRKGTPRDISIFMLSVLGVGLFSYYQGRSADTSLTAVWYPAILLLILAADYSLNSFKRNQWRTYVSLVVLVPSAVIICCAFFGVMSAGYSLYPAIYDRLTTPGNAVTIAGINFIDSNCRQGEPVLILSSNAGVYYAEGETVNPLNGPGFGELFLKRDHNAILSAIEKHKVGKIFVDTAFMGEPDLIKAVVNNYSARGTSSFGNIIMYERSKKSGIEELKPWLLPEISATRIHLQYLPDKGIMTDGKLFYFRGMGLQTPGFSGTRTYEILIKPRSSQQGSATVIDSTQSATTPSGFSIQYLDLDENAYQLVFGDGKTWHRKDGLRFSLSQWHYLALVIDSDKVSLYDNGAIVAEMRMKKEIGSEASIMFIGDRPLVGNPFSGDINELRISDCALKGTEIRQIYENIDLR